MICFYDNSIESKCSAAMIAKFTNNYDEGDYILVDYNDDMTKLISNINAMDYLSTIYFVNANINNETIYQLFDYISNAKIKIVLFNNDDAAFNRWKELYSKYNIGGTCTTEHCIPMLTWMYLLTVIKLESDESLRIEDVVISYDEIPNYIRTLDETDKEFEIRNWLKLGTQCYDTIPTSQFWKDILSTDTYCRTDTKIQNILQNGYYLNKYMNKRNQDIIKSLSYKDIFQYMDENGKEHSHTCIVINDSSDDLSIFDNLLNKYELGIKWHYAQDRYNYIICSESANIDCSKIAKLYGGYGTRKHAKFSLDRGLYDHI